MSPILRMRPFRLDLKDSRTATDTVMVEADRPAEAIMAIKAPATAEADPAAMAVPAIALLVTEEADLAAMAVLAIALLVTEEVDLAATDGQETVEDSLAATNPHHRPTMSSTVLVKTN